MLLAFYPINSPLFLVLYSTPLIVPFSSIGDVTVPCANLTGIRINLLARINTNGGLPISNWNTLKLELTELKCGKIRIRN